MDCGLGERSSGLMRETGEGREAAGAVAKLYLLAGLRGWSEFCGLSGEMNAGAGLFPLRRVDGKQCLEVGDV